MFLGKAPDTTNAVQHSVATTQCSHSAVPRPLGVAMLRLTVSRQARGESRQASGENKVADREGVVQCWSCRHPPRQSCNLLHLSSRGPIQSQKVANFAALADPPGLGRRTCGWRMRYWRKDLEREWPALPHRPLLPSRATSQPPTSMTAGSSSSQRTGCACRTRAQHQHDHLDIHFRWAAHRVPTSHGPPLLARCVTCLLFALL